MAGRPVFESRLVRVGQSDHSIESQHRPRLQSRWHRGCRAILAIDHPSADQHVSRVDRILYRPLLFSLGKDTNDFIRSLDLEHAGKSIVPHRHLIYSQPARMSLTTQLVLGFLLAVSIAYLAYRVHSLSRDGAIAAVFVGTIVFGLGGLQWAVLLLAFFISSSALSRLFKDRKRGTQ